MPHASSEFMTLASDVRPPDSVGSLSDERLEQAATITTKNNVAT
jgi:hypothetical protein